MRPVLPSSVAYMVFWEGWLPPAEVRHGDRQRPGLAPEAQASREGQLHRIEANLHASFLRGRRS